MRRGGYNGQEPCPGCQQQVWRASKGEVCPTCKTHLSAGKIALEQLSSGETRSARMKHFTHSPGRYHLPDGLRFDRKEQPFTSYRMRTISFMDNHVEFSAAWLNTQIRLFLDALAIHPETPREFDVYVDDGTSWREPLTMESKQSIAWIYFYDALSRYIEFMYNRGKTDGENLLFSLVKQEVGFQPLTKTES